MGKSLKIGLFLFLIAFLISAMVNLVLAVRFQQVVNFRVNQAVQASEGVCQSRIDSLNVDANRKIELEFYRGTYDECYVQWARAGMNPIYRCQMRVFTLFQLGGYDGQSGEGWEWAKKEIEEAMDNISAGEVY